MGKRGPKPEPTLITMARGNPSKKTDEQLNHDQPKPDPEIPPCPEHLDEEARKEWDWISKYLFKQGLISIIDKAQLAVYCQAWSRWVQAEKKIASTPWIMKTAKGGAMINPYIKIADQAMAKLSGALAAFGMSPSSRSSIKMNEMPEADGDPWVEYKKRIREAQENRKKKAK